MAWHIMVAHLDVPGDVSTALSDEGVELESEAPFDSREAAEARAVELNDESLSNGGETYYWVEIGISLSFEG